jgi:hypothetical protein
MPITRTIAAWLQTVANRRQDDSRRKRGHNGIDTGGAKPLKDNVSGIFDNKGGLSAMKLMLALPMIALAGCLASRIQSTQSQGTDSSWSRFDPEQRLSPSAFEQNATMEDTSVHEDPNLLKAGVPRGDIVAAFGTPNQIDTRGLQEEDVYEFNPDGSKFVKPKIYARNIAAGFFTHGISTVVHQARIHHTEEQLTIYHLAYGPDGTVQSVRKESGRDVSSDEGGFNNP